MFEIGDVVRVSKTPVDTDTYYAFVTSMDKYRGKEYTIKNITSIDGHKAYILEDCINPYTMQGWFFEEQWLEFVDKQKPIEFEENDLINLFT